MCELLSAGAGTNLKEASLAAESKPAAPAAEDLSTARVFGAASPSNRSVLHGWNRQDGS